MGSCHREGGVAGQGGRMTTRDLYYLFAGYHYCPIHDLWTRYECQAR